MASPTLAPTGAGNAAAAAPAPAPVPTPAVLLAMLRTSPKVSDLFFSPGRLPLVEINGHLKPVAIPGMTSLTPGDTRRIASDLIGSNEQAIATLRENGSCDVSYSVPGSSRFRVNVFMQRGSCAIVMRVIPGKVPDFDALNLPPELKHIVQLRNGNASDAELSGGYRRCFARHYGHIATGL